MDINTLLWEAAKRAEAAMVWVVTPPEKRADHAPWMGLGLARLLDKGIVGRILPDLIEAHDRICALQDTARLILDAVCDADGPGITERIREIEERLERIESAIGRIHEATVDDSEPPWSSR